MSEQPVNEELTAMLRAHLAGPDTDIQVYFTPPRRRELETWLASRGLYLFQVPSEDPIPVFGIGVRQPGDTTPPGLPPVPRYEAGSGIRPPTKSGKVRGVAREVVDGGGVELWFCEHDHAPGVRDVRKMLPHQREAAQACAEDWLRQQILADTLTELPVTRDEG